MNESVNQTLSRTILTSFTVFLVLLCLYLLGGTVIHDFAFTMIFGVLFGTYSSIFVASAIVIYWKKWRGTLTYEAFDFFQALIARLPGGHCPFPPFSR